MNPGLGLRELTAAASGGVSVLELCGEGALERARGLSRRPDLAVGALCFTQLFSTDREAELLDEAMLWVESQNRVELHLHGSVPLVARLRRELQLPDAEEPCDLEGRAQALCAQAASAAAARVYLDQAEGALRVELERLILASEAQRASGLEALLAASRELTPLFSPPLIVLAGPVNAGKSTLFNLLVGRERVITDAAQGTTRDVIRERILLGQYAFDLVDSAGLRVLGEDPAAQLERQGQRLGERMREQADLVLWLCPAESAALPAASSQALVLHSQAPRAELGESGARAMIAALEQPLASARVVRELLERELALPREPWQPGRALLFDSISLQGAEKALASGSGLVSGLESMLAR